MNRRDFLRMLGIGAAAAGTPRIISDVGTNLYRMDQSLIGDWREGGNYNGYTTIDPAYPYPYFIIVGADIRVEATIRL